MSATAALTLGPEIVYAERLSGLRRSSRGSTDLRLGRLSEASSSRAPTNPTVRVVPGIATGDE